MKKFKSIFVTLTISLFFFTACKKNSDDKTPTLTLAISGNTFGTVNSCTWGDGNNRTNVGTPPNVAFTISDPAGIMKQNTWELFEQIDSQPAYSLGLGSIALSGNKFSKTGGCLTFGPFSSFVFKYYVLCNGVKSNTASVTINKPAGAF